MTRRASWLATAALALAAVLFAGCAERALTQLVVVTDADLRVPEQLDTVEIEITPPTGPSVRRAAVLSGPAALSLPVTLGIVHRGGPLGPVRVSVTGYRDANPVVTRLAEVEMVAGRTLVLALPLEASCVGVVCEERQTCRRGSCRDVLVLPSELFDFDGSVPRLDDAGSGCAAVPELCNDFDDDCDGRVDEGIDTATDPDNCGMCGRQCEGRPQAQPSCRAGVCEITCDEGYGDCNASPADGCEEPLNTLSMCQACGVPCNIDHGAASCFTGECGVDQCAPGWGDCNGQVSDGCEQPLNDPRFCGMGCSACAPANAVPSCGDGECRILSCLSGFGDCDRTSANGCETTLGVPAACSGCMDACPGAENAAPACVDGRCSIVCTTGFADCDGDRGTGCETPLDTTTNCTRCGLSCSLAHAVSRCGAMGCEIASCDVGWDDCDRVTSNGCETPLDTSADCGACGSRCSAPTPVCDATRTCATDCVAPTTPCGLTCANTDTSLSHCGGCDQACAPANAVAACAGGICRIARCNAGFGDCDGDAMNGCETALVTLTDCETCGGLCAPRDATGTCASGQCLIQSCNPGRGDCNAVAADGCETPLNTLASCGACGVRCSLPNATTSCASGTCEFVSCLPGFANCNMDLTDGCERPLGTLTDCRGCGDVCDVPGATESCASGTCTLLACDAGLGNCNGSATDGCETSLTSLANCGSCGRTCSASRATPSCSTGTCTFTCNTDWGNCDGNAANGCEVQLNTASRCGSCTNMCSLPTPTCGPLSGGTRTCVSGCPTGQIRCGSTCTNTATNAQHCGMCDNACAAPPGATAGCSASMCGIGTCNVGFADCDMMAANGCETSTRTTTDCGSCGTVCSAPANATATCATGMCGFTCDSGYASCDGMAGTGCETMLGTDTHCSACGDSCVLAPATNATGMCMSGACALTCMGAFRDCNSVFSDGCEVDTQSDAMHCGGCGMPCPVGQPCVAGACMAPGG